MASAAGTSFEGTPGSSLPEFFSDFVFLNAIASVPDTWKEFVCVWYKIWSFPYFFNQKKQKF